MQREEPEGGAPRLQSKGGGACAGEGVGARRTVEG